MRRKLILGPACAAALLAVPVTALATGRHDDGVRGNDHVQIGTVASFADGVLTVKLADGSSLAAKVDGSTRVTCKSPIVPPTTSTPSTRRHDHGDGGGRQDGARGHRGRSRQCATTDLTAGSPVTEAEVRGTTTGAFYRKVELSK